MEVIIGVAIVVAVIVISKISQRLQASKQDDQQSEDSINGIELDGSLESNLARFCRGIEPPNPKLAKLLEQQNDAELSRYAGGLLRQNSGD